MIRRNRDLGIFGIPSIDDTIIRPLEINGGLTSEMLRKGLATGQLLSGAQQQQDRKSSSTAQIVQTPPKEQNKR